MSCTKGIQANLLLNVRTPVAIIDHGLDNTQPELTPKIVAGDNSFHVEPYGSQRLSHGTAVAGVAAASANNVTGSSGGIAGVDWNAKIISQDIWDYWNCFCLNAITNQHGNNLVAKKINSAVKYSPNVWTLNHSYILDGGYSPTVAEAFANAYKNNRVSCVAAGNNGAYRTDIYPANYKQGLIAV